MQSNQTILVSDKNGNHTGEYVDKELAHTGKGKRHLAITVLLYNSKGQVLLQHRKHKIHSDIWDFTGSTHHLHREDGTNETTEDAVYRCLKTEYGIVEQMPLKVVGGVNYFAADGDYCENEHDIIVLGEYNGEFKTNSSVAYDFKWVDEKDFLKDILKHPKNYAPWVVMAAKKLPILEDEFNNLLKDFLGTFEPYSSSFFKNRGKIARKYPKLIENFYADLEDISAGGKRMRAFLVYLGYLVGGHSSHKASDGKRDMLKVLPITLAIELIHTFLLIHDDIIDKSDTRRGKKTLHVRYARKFGDHYGLSQAIILGDVASWEAAGLINSSSFNATEKVLCLEMLNKVVLETIYGEALDVENSFKRVKVDDINLVTDLKTARYSFVGPLTIGARLAGATKKELAALERFGMSMGFAFQLQDDVLGVFGDEKILGKSVLSDMREGKNTLLIYKTRQLADKKDQVVIDKIWGKEKADTKELAEIRKIMKKTGAYGWCINEMDKLKNESVLNLKQITNNVAIGRIFAQLAEFIVSRRA